MVRLSIAALVAASSFGCGGAEEAEFVVEGHEAPCHGVVPQVCLSVDRGDGDGSNLFYDPIEGFEFEWGVRSRLRVAIHPIENPGEDAPTARFELLERLDSEPVAPGTTFSILMDPFFVETSGDGFLLLGERLITCDDAQLCTNIGDRLAVEAPFTVTLAHPADPRDESLPLEAISLRDL